jgi:hypothetical protein
MTFDEACKKARLRGATLLVNALEEETHVQLIGKQRPGGHSVMGAGMAPDPVVALEVAVLEFDSCWHL